MPDIFRDSLKKREEAAGVREKEMPDVNAHKKSSETVQWSKPGDDPRKKNLDQRDKLLKQKGYIK